MFFSTSFAFLYILGKLSKLYAESETVLSNENNQTTAQNSVRGRSSNKQRNVKPTFETDKNSNSDSSFVISKNKRKRKFKTDRYLHNNTLKTGSFHIENTDYLIKPHPCGSYYIDGWFIN